MLTRFAILGDIHAEDQRLAAALDHISPLNLDAILCVGDIVDGRGDAARCIALLRAANARCVRGNHDRWWSQGKAASDECSGPGLAERGPWPLPDAARPALRARTGQSRNFADATPREALDTDAVSWLAALPPTATFDTPLGALLLCHGLSENDMIGVEPHDEGYALEANIDLQNLIDRADHQVIVNGHTHSRMVRSFGRKLKILNAGTLKGTTEPGFGVVDLAARTVDWLAFAEDLTLTPAAQQRI